MYQEQSVVKIYYHEANAPLFSLQSVVKIYQEQPVVKTYQEQPVVKTYQEQPVVKIYQEQPVVKIYYHKTNAPHRQADPKNPSTPFESKINTIGARHFEESFQFARRSGPCCGRVCFSVLTSRARVLSLARARSLTHARTHTHTLSLSHELMRSLVHNSDGQGRAQVRSVPAEDVGRS